MLRRRTTAVAVVAFILASVLLAGLAVQGCGGKGNSEKAETEGSVQTQATEGNSTSGKATSPGQSTTPKNQTTPSSSNTDINGAIAAAKASAQANNPALGDLTVLAVKIVGDWARVDMQPVDRSTDAASWLLEKVDGKWTVVDFGTSVMPSDHPDAPAEIFQ